MDWSEFARWEWLLLEGLFLVLLVVELIRTRRLIRLGRETEALAEAEVEGEAETARQREDSASPEA